MDFDLSSLVMPEGLEKSFKPMVTSTIEGILDEDDLRELALGYGPGDVRPVDEDNPADLKKIREKHHHVARLKADGLTNRMIAQISGYTDVYVGVLLNNPAMVELVEMYRIQSGAAVKLATEKLATVGMKAVEKLELKLDGEDLSTLELTAIAKLSLDRGGLGPQSKVHSINENHNIDYSELARLNAEARHRNHEFIVPVDDVRKAIDAVDSKLLSGPKK